MQQHIQRYNVVNAVEDALKGNFLDNSLHLPPYSHLLSFPSLIISILSYSSRSCVQVSRSMSVTERRDSAQTRNISLSTLRHLPK